MYSEVLVARVRQLKETPEGVEYMCKEMDRIYGMGEEQGRAMERKNTERERKKAERERKKAERERKKAKFENNRADRLGKRNILLEQKLAELGVTMPV